jgi:lysozyme
MTSAIDAGLALIKHFEGCVLTAYQDVAGIWTIGYGHIEDVYPGLVWTQDQADTALEEDVSITETRVQDMVGDVPTTDNQLSAMVSLAYNIGSGGFKSSSVLRYHRLGSAAMAADAFLLWDKATVDGQLKVFKGLLERRQAESALYLE